MPSMDHVSDLNSWPIEIAMIGEGTTGFSQSFQEKPARCPWLTFCADDRRAFCAESAGRCCHHCRVFANINSRISGNIERWHFAEKLTRAQAIGFARYNVERQSPRGDSSRTTREIQGQDGRAEFVTKHPETCPNIPSKSNHATPATRSSLHEHNHSFSDATRSAAARDRPARVWRCSSRLFSRIPRSLASDSAA
jgi:hypothetical protein